MRAELIFHDFWLTVVTVWLVGIFTEIRIARYGDGTRSQCFCPWD